MDFSFYQILIGKWVVKVMVAIVSRVHFITPITTVASMCYDKIPCHLMRVHVKRSSYRHVLTKPKNPQSREPY